MSICSLDGLFPAGKITTIKGIEKAVSSSLKLASIVYVRNV